MLTTVTTTMWVGGNATRVQYPGGAGPEFTGDSRMDQVANAAWTDVTGLPIGTGMIFNGQGGNANWFHLPIPTPTVISGTDTLIAQVTFLFHSDPEVEIDEVMVFDGANAIPLGMLSRPFPSGDFSNGSIEGKNRLVVHPPRVVNWGLGLSLHVSFRKSGQIRFVGAGVDFQYQVDLP